MTLSTFPTFLTFLTFGLVGAGWLKLVTTKTGGRAIHRLQVNALLFFGAQETLPQIRGEALGRRLAAEQTRSLLDGLVRAGWLRLVTTKRAAALSIVGVSIRCSFPGHQCQKGQEGRKGGCAA